MIPLPPSTRIYLACGATDMRKGFDGLAVLVQQVLEQSPHSGALFAFRGKRGDLVKLLWYDGQGMCLFSKRMDRGRFVWPVTKTGKVSLTSAQLSMLLEGIDWRRPERTATPLLAGAAWRVIRTIRPKYSCRSCERIVQAPAPVKAIARGKASFATLAHVVVSKFDHHLPLYRQAEMMAAQGLDIDRSTLAGWAGQAAHLLDPIVSRIREEGLKAAKIHSDDTPVPMLVPGKGKAAQGRLWTYVADDRASGSKAPALVWYRFTPDRSGIHPQTELKNFTGLLQADGYAGYEKLYATGRILEVACWAHFRRKIFENHQASPTPLTTDLLERIAALYRVEDEVRGQPPDIRRQRRQQKTRPLIDELRLAIDDALRRLSPKAAMAKALAYGRKRWTALTRFMDDGRAEIDNNIAERAMRSVAIGRKNWLFAGSQAGGERAAAIYSVIETAKLNGVEPQAYIADVIEKIASGWPASRWDELMPWNWTQEEPPVAQAA